MNAGKLTRAVLVALLALSTGLGARADDGVGILTLDGLSFLSFEGVEALAIPAGSTLKFQFGPGSTSSTATFSVAPQDVSIGPIPLGSDRGTLQYGLATPASGTLSRSDGGFVMSFAASVSVMRTDSDASTAAVYNLVFTTEHASAKGTKTGSTAALDGMRVVPAARYVQLVGAVANQSRAVPHPGRAVSTVLSGTFDWLPTLD